VPLEIVMAWICNGTNRSTLAIVIFHFMVVLTCNFLNATPGANIISTVLWFLMAIAVIRVWPARTRIVQVAGRPLSQSA